MHDAMLRNKYMVPALKNSIVTYEFLEKVKDGMIWLPRSNECFMYSCPSQPNKEVLAQYIYDAINTFLQNADPAAVPREKKDAIRALAEAVQAQPPDKHWQLLVLNHIDPSHMVFQKGYVKPKGQRKKEDEYQIEDRDGFFEGLPDCKFVKRAKIPGITQEAKLTKRREALERAHARVNERIAEAQEKQTRRQRQESQREDALRQRVFGQGARASFDQSQHQS